jgi:AcrR family transcriptional regulator
MSAMPEKRRQQLSQLPRGRHGLSREVVAESQRSRILEAMVEVCAERGYSDTRVADVIAYAGVSRKTFYELFTDKEDCFLAAYDAQVRVLLGETAAAYQSDPSAPWPERLRRGLTAVLTDIAEHPARARFAIVEVLAAGPRALARRDAAIRQFTDFVDAGRAETSVEVPGILALLLTGGVSELIYSEILHGAVAQLPSRVPDLLFALTQPFLGSERAAEERTRAQAAARAEAAGAEAVQPVSARIADGATGAAVSDAADADRARGRSTRAT